MLPAQPPNSRRICGTRNDTFSMWILSGRMWLAKRSPNTMMVSKASEPQIRARLMREAPSWTQPPGVRVYDMPVATREGDQREAGALGEAHGERRGGRQRGEKGNAHGGAFLHHLVAGAARDQHVAGREVDTGAGQGADRLVERVVA